MKHVLSAIVSTVALACLVLASAGCSQLPSAQQALDSIETTPAVSSTATLVPGVLTVGVSANTPPYVYEGTGSHPVVGVDVDVAMALATQMNMTVRFVNVGSNYDAAANGACDVVMGVPSNVDLAGREMIVGTYAESAPALFAKGAGAVPSIAELAETPVGVQENSVSAYALQTIVPTVQFQPYPTLNAAFEALEAGEVRYVACDSFMGGYLAAAYNDISLVGAMSLPETRGVAVSTANAELTNGVSAAMNAIATNGELDRVLHTWVGDLAPVTASNQIANQQAVEPAPEEYYEGEESFVEGEGEE